MSDVPESEPRRLGIIVLLLIWVSPMLFVWLTLWPGYSRTLREAAFAYAVLLGFLPLAVLLAFN